MPTEASKTWKDPPMSSAQHTRLRTDTWVRTGCGSEASARPWSTHRQSMRHRKGVHMGKTSQSVLNGGKLYPSAHRCLQTQWGQTPPRSQSRKAFLSPSSSPDLSTWSIRVPEDVVRRGHFLRVGGGGRKTHPFTPLTSLLGSLIGPDPKRENGDAQSIGRGVNGS